MPGSQKILLVDDDENIADLLNRAAAKVFPQANFIHVTSFSQAVEYLNGLQGSGPRLILLDINLNSAVTGIEFLKIVRQHPQGRLVPVVMLSADQEDQKVKQAYDLGANAFTSKPDSFAGWKAYVEQLRDYWFNTATTPRLYFVEE